MKPFDADVKFYHPKTLLHSRYCLHPISAPNLTDSGARLLACGFIVSF